MVNFFLESIIEFRGITLYTRTSQEHNAIGNIHEKQILELAALSLYISEAYKTVFINFFVVLQNITKRKPQH